VAKTTIEWADEVWNPVVGCTKVSQGCANCYAERIYERFHPGQKFTDVHMIPGKLDDPLHWKKPRRVFVNSMSDLFHEDVTDEFIVKIWRTMFAAQQHTFIILTKRARRMFEWVSTFTAIFEAINQEGGEIVVDTPLPNVWLGVSAEDQKAADERIPLLLQTPAAVRFVSVEPMLGPVDLSPKDRVVESLSPWYSEDGFDPTASQKVIDRAHWLFPKIDWVICGGESGPDARPMHPDWVRGLRDQCENDGVPFFLKQMMVDGKLVKMPELDGRVWDQYPGGE